MKNYLFLSLILLCFLFSSCDNSTKTIKITSVEITDDEWQSAFEMVENLLSRSKAEESSESFTDGNNACVEMIVEENILIDAKFAILSSGPYYFQYTVDGEGRSYYYKYDEKDDTRNLEYVDDDELIPEDEICTPGVWAEYFKDDVWYAIATNSKSSDFKNQSWELLSSFEENERIKNQSNNRKNILEWLSFLKNKGKPENLTSGAYKVDFGDDYYTFDNKLKIFSKSARLGFEKTDDGSVYLKNVEFILDSEDDFGDMDEPYLVTFNYKNGDITSEPYWPLFIEPESN